MVAYVFLFSFFCTLVLHSRSAAPRCNTHRGSLIRCRAPQGVGTRTRCVRAATLRRDILGVLVTGALGAACGTVPVESARATADGATGAVGPLASSVVVAEEPGSTPFNPLGLKGQFWETGKPYRKSDVLKELPDSQGLLGALEQAQRNIADVEGLIEGQEYDAASEALRGGVGGGEARLRIVFAALMQRLEDTPRNRFAAPAVRQDFAQFIRGYAQLDEALVIARRESSPDKGVISIVGLAMISPFSAANEVARERAKQEEGPRDERIELLDMLGATENALRELVAGLRDLEFADLAQPSSS